VFYELGVVGIGDVRVLSQVAALIIENMDEIFFIIIFL
jgi:hypothetical protein